MKKWLKLSGLIALGLALLIVLLAALGCGPPEEAVPRSYSCAVYTEQGCAKFVVASGGEIEIQSGGTFDLQSGATVDFSGGVDLDGATLTMDADGDTTLVASQDDVITATITDTTYIVIANGNLKVGDGAPSTSQNGEDAYVEGGFEVDGTARFDGAIDANSTADIAGNLSSSVGPITMTDNVLVDGAADAIQLTVQGYTTQTNSLAVFEQSDGTDVATVSNAGLLTLAGGVTLSNGDAVVADDVRVTAQTTLTVTDSTAFTPTGTYQGLQVSAASSEVTPTLAMAGTAGDLLVLINTTTPTISIADSGTTMLSAEWEAGQYDTIVLWCDGTNWLEISRTNN